MLEHYKLVCVIRNYNTENSTGPPVSLLLKGIFIDIKMIMKWQLFKLNQ